MRGERSGIGFPRPSAISLLPSPFCLLPTAFCLLPTAFCTSARGSHFLVQKSRVLHAPSTPKHALRSSGGPAERAKLVDFMHVSSAQRRAIVGVQIAKQQNGSRTTITNWEVNSLAIFGPPCVSGEQAGTEGTEQRRPVRFRWRTDRCDLFF